MNIKSLSFRMPNSLVLIFCIMVVALVLTWLMPAGTFELTVNEHGKEYFVPGTYKALEGVGNQSIWALFTAVPRAFYEVQGIIFFVLIVGGTLRVIRESGVIDAVLSSIIESCSNNHRLFISSVVFLFSAASATFGMAEEYIPLACVLVTACAAMRMDAIVAVGIVVIGYGVGYAATIMNPFTLLIAQDIAGLHPISGWQYRLVLFFLFLVIGLHHICSYASRVKERPEASLVYETYNNQASPLKDHHLTFTFRRIAILALVLVALVSVIYGITARGWHFVELGAVFIALSIGVGLIAGFGANQTSELFCRGAVELGGTIVLIGFARAIALLLEEGQILHSLVFFLSQPLAELAPELSAVCLLAIHSVLTIFVSSGSSQAYLTR